MVAGGWDPGPEGGGAFMRQERAAQSHTEQPVLGPAQIRPPSAAHNVSWRWMERPGSRRLHWGHPPREGASSSLTLHS